MNRSVIIALIFATVVLSLCEASPGPRHFSCGRCRPDQVCNTCGTACPPTCDNPKPRICTMQCVIGCQCKEGLYKQKDGSCIEPSKCPK